jgi:hypothetical protein
MAATGLVLLVHGALLLILLHSHRIRTHEEPAVAFVSVWIEPRQAKPESAPREATPSPAPAPRRSVAPAPPAPPASEAPVTAPISAPEPTPAPIDWAGEAAAAAARLASPDKGSDSFSPAPKLPRKPCEPPKSSFEWHPEEMRAGLLPLPFVRLGERCVVGLGFFGCALGELPKANGKLFDDVKEGKTQQPTVPNPNHCD